MVYYMFDSGLGIIWLELVFDFWIELVGVEVGLDVFVLFNFVY